MFDYTEHKLNRPSVCKYAKAFEGSGSPNRMCIDEEWGWVSIHLLLTVMNSDFANFNNLLHLHHINYAVYCKQDH